MTNLPQPDLTETEVETLKKMQDLLGASFNSAADMANSRYLELPQINNYRLMASTFADSYVRVTDLLSRKRAGGPS